ncbi:hypothetical protein AB0J47_12615 [Nocardia sp. NPDC049737]|uniref:hypothetical protein n=1 Tax=Nocardia sp. NPDC049737 TaxID=3154358 RepID=UPI00343B09E4
MASRQSTAGVETYRGWLKVPAADHEWTPRDEHLLVDDWDVIASPTARPRLKLAA